MYTSSHSLICTENNHSSLQYGPCGYRGTIAGIDVVYVQVRMYRVSLLRVRIQVGNYVTILYSESSRTGIVFVPSSFVAEALVSG
jgi:hypothetical protein